VYVAHNFTEEERTFLHINNKGNTKHLVQDSQASRRSLSLNDSESDKKENLISM